MSDYHVVKNPSGGWDAKQDNAQRSSFHSDTQTEVETAAKRFAVYSGGGEVRIHGLDGRIRDAILSRQPKTHFHQEIKSIKFENIFILMNRNKWQ